MSPSPRNGHLGKKIVDRLVGVTSGSVPVKALDSSTAAYRVVVFVGLVAVVLAGWLVWHSIYSATKTHPLALANNTNGPDAVAELKKLKTKDTDGDAISDYDELYTAHTSPYLKDSDGDGTDDKKEIDKGFDPNCPQGRTCSSSSVTATNTDNSSLTPVFLRQALLSSGVSQSVLDQTDDATLISLYQQVIAGGDGDTNAATNTVTNSSAVTPTLNSLQNLSASDIRSLLEKNGISAAILQGVDDATLKSIFQQSLSSSQNQ